MTPVWGIAPHPDATQAEGPGNFREHEIHPFSAGMKPVSFPLVPAELDGWLALVAALDPIAEDFPEGLAKIHTRFEQIHPFIDGNGRTGRLLLNLILVRLGYPPMIVYKNERNTYLKALRRADGGDFGALGEFIARAILESLYRFIVPAVAGPARLVPLTALARPDLNAVALRAAAVRGVLQATKGPDGQWRSSKNWVDEYSRSRWQRRAG